MPSIADLVADFRVERVDPDENEALALIEHANLHLKSARAIVASDIAGAYQLLYDAARKAVAAHMSARGYRAKADRPGAHAAGRAQVEADLQHATEIVRAVAAALQRPGR